MSPPTRVLLTGANGFVGSHILSLLLTSGFQVRAIVRSQSKASGLHSLFPTPSLETFIVPDITTPGAFNEAVQPTSTGPFEIIIHTASPFLYKAISSNIEFLDPAVKGTRGILQSLKEFGGEGVKRVVLTSSCAAVVDFKKAGNKKPRKLYREEDWNPTTWEEALVGSPNTGYQASKKFAEKAAWDFIETEKPCFDLVVLNPPMVYGPPRHTISSPDQLNESNARIYKLFINSKEDAELPPNGMHVYTDVRDLAKAHLLAAFTSEASNQRFIICASQITSQEISDILRKNILELSSRTPKGVEGGNPIDENAYDCNSAKVESILGLGFRSKEETFAELGKQLLEIEKGGL